MSQPLGDIFLGDLERLVDLPELEHGSYHTLGGLMLSVLNRNPTEGAKAVIGDFGFGVMDMEGRRRDKGLVSIGTFHTPDKVILWAGVSLVDYPTLTVTLEPEDGDQTSSGQVVLKAPVGDVAAGR